MINFLVIAVIGLGVGYFVGRLYHNRYGLGQWLNALIGLAGALLGAFVGLWLTTSTAEFAWDVWLGAAVGAFLLVWLADFVRGRQYE